MEDTHNKSKPEPEAAFASDSLLFGLTESGAQIMAHEIIGRDLTDAELRTVKNILETKCLTEIEIRDAAKSAITEAVKEPDTIVLKVTSDAAKDGAEFIVNWDEHHRAVVPAKDALDALEVAAQYAKENDTKVDSDGYRVMDRFARPTGDIAIASSHGTVVVKEHDVD